MAVSHSLSEQRPCVPIGDPFSLALREVHLIQCAVVGIVDLSGLQGSAVWEIRCEQQAFHTKGAEDLVGPCDAIGTDVIGEDRRHVDKAVQRHQLLPLECTHVGYDQLQIRIAFFDADDPLGGTDIIICIGIGMDRDGDPFLLSKGVDRPGVIRVDRYCLDGS